MFQSIKKNKEFEFRCNKCQLTTTLVSEYYDLELIKDINETKENMMFFTGNPNAFDPLNIETMFAATAQSHFNPSNNYQQVPSTMQRAEQMYYSSTAWKFGATQVVVSGLNKVATMAAYYYNDASMIVVRQKTQVDGNQMFNYRVFSRSRNLTGTSQWTPWYYAPKQTAEAILDGFNGKQKK